MWSRSIYLPDHIDLWTVCFCKDCDGCTAGLGSYFSPSKVFFLATMSLLEIISVVLLPQRFLHHIPPAWPHGHDCLGQSLGTEQIREERRKEILSDGVFEKWLSVVGAFLILSVGSQRAAEGAAHKYLCHYSLPLNFVLNFLLQWSVCV